MATTPDLGIPELSQAQANPDITHNEALVLLQALQVGVVSLGDNAPPVTPTEGDTYILGSSPTGAWSGRANAIATYWGGSWRFVPGRNDAGAIIAMGARHEGLKAWVRDENKLYIWTGSPLAWTEFVSGGGAASSVIFTPTGDISATNVQAAIAEVDSEKITKTRAAVSVVGRSTNSPGDASDITAGANDRVLARVSDALSWVQLTIGMFADNVITAAKFAFTAQYRLLGRSSSGAGGGQEIASSADVFTMLGSANNAAIRSNIGAAGLADNNIFTGVATFRHPSLTNILVVESEATAPSLVVTAYNDTPSATAQYKMQRTRGTRTSPTAVQQNDFIGTFQAQMYADSQFRNSWGITGLARAATPSTPDVETELRFDIGRAGANNIQPALGMRYSTGLSWDSSVFMDTNRVFRNRFYTVATLPSGVAGMRTFVSDATAPAWGAAVVGGGSVDCPVFYGDGAWNVG